MTMEQQAQAEAERMVDQFATEIAWVPNAETLPTWAAAKHCATIANDKMIVMRVQPIEYYEKIGLAILAL